MHLWLRREVGLEPRRLPAIRPFLRAGEPHQPEGFTYGYNSRNTWKRPMADSSSRFGFVAFAETWNGRLAMLGFVIGLATELLTGQGILSQIGLG